MNINLVTDRDIRALKKKWFGVDRATDVISFGDIHDPFAEIYVSVDTAKRQAVSRGVSIEDEVLRLIIHGIAHLEGHNDTDIKAFAKMREREWQLLLKAIS